MAASSNPVNASVAPRPNSISPLPVLSSRLLVRSSPGLRRISGGTRGEGRRDAMASPFLSSSSLHDFGVWLELSMINTLGANPVAIYSKTRCHKKVNRLSLKWKGGFSSMTRSTKEDQGSFVDEGDGRPPFDLNLAVLLAGFAFEAYTSPPKDVGYREIDAADCQTVFLSDSFVREVYDGQLFIKLRKGLDLPALDPWGTSDPYVIFHLDGQVAKSNVKWATKEPTWNEDFTLNINTASAKNMQVSVWDANLLTAHRRMGNGVVNLGPLCDGNFHEVKVDLEGLGGGGKIYLEVKYESYDQINEEIMCWRIPFVSEFLHEPGELSFL